MSGERKNGGGAIATRPLLIIYASILVGMLSVAAMPVFVGAYVDTLHFSVAEAGRVASAETLGGAAGSIFTAIFLARPGVNLRNAALACFVVLALAHVASGFVSGLGLFAAVRAVAGFAAGAVQSLGSVYISSLKKPDRAFAISFGLLSVAGPLGLWCAPPLIAAIGLAHVYWAYAAGLLVALPLMLLYPRRREPRDAADGVEPASKAPRAVGVGLIWAAIVVNFICNGGVWIYAEQIGRSAGFDAITLGRLLAVAMLLGTLGVALVGMIEDRFGRLKPLIAAHLALGGAVLWVMAGPGMAGYFVAILLLNLSVVVLTPYFLAMLAEAGRGESASVFGNAAILIGYGAGPGVLSFFVRGAQFHFAFVVAAIGVGVSLALTLAGAYALRARASEKSAMLVGASGS
ncbi:MFS transporter [Phenylobacterium sp.]|uniref:MFS transporter n=1 Tax=Phenylobacterium sp. TaxID=1871053 RepID=UPI0035B09ED3